MQKLTILFVILSLGLRVSAQSCLPEGIYFSHQSQIDQFRANHPGCNIIEGNVNIEGEDITNLDSLKYITAIVGDLTIGYGWNGDNPNLFDLKGLNNLFQIGGTLYIKSSDALMSLNGLQGLHTIGDGLFIYNNNELSSIAELTGLTSVGASLKIYGNASLVSLVGLERITTVNGDIWFATIQDTCMTGLEGLTHVTGNFEISGNVNMTSLHGLESLTDVGGDFYIHDNPAVANMFGVGNLTEIGHDLTIEANSSLVDIYGLEHLFHLGGSLHIWDNENLSSFEGLNNLEEIDTILFIMNNPQIVNLLGFSNLETIGGDLLIQANPSLINLTGLESLTSVSGDIWITHNESLVSLTGLDHVNSSSIRDFRLYLNHSLTYCAIESICNYLSNPSGVVEIYDNGEDCNNPPAIAHQCGFTMPCLPFGDYNFLSQSEIDSFHVNYTNCHKLEGEVEIRGEDITNLSGLSGVDSISFRLSIYSNGLLQNLDGLDSIKYIGASLVILGNDVLNDIKSLEHFNTDSIVVLEIENNPVLTTCNIESVCHFIANPGPWADINIYDNAEGCVTKDEVEAACLAGMNEKPEKEFCSWFPNPVKQVAHFRLQIEDCRRVTVKIYNIQGQEIATVLDQELSPGIHFIDWNASSFSPGLYFYRTSTIDNRQSTMGKIVVVR
jgi:hypothetical protein